MIGKKDVRELGKKFLAKLLKGIGHEKGYSIHNKCVTVLKAMFNYCIDYEDDFPIEFNPASSLKKLSSAPRTRYLTQDEALRLLSTLKELKHPIFTDLFMLALFTGARISNVKSMKWSEVIFDDDIWIVPAIKTKTRKNYYLPLCEQARQILDKRYKKRDLESEFVFPSPKGSSTGHVMGGCKFWKAAIQDAGLYSNNRDVRIRQHDLRRTFATWQAMGGAYINVISRSLGHSDIKNTQIYAQVSLSSTRAAISSAFQGIEQGI